MTPIVVNPPQERDARDQPRRHLHLHAEPQLLGPRHLHLPRLRRREPVEPRDRRDHRRAQGSRPTARWSRPASPAARPRASSPTTTRPRSSVPRVPNLKVVLYAQSLGTSGLTIVGASFADSAGNYAVTSDPRDDGGYRYFVQAFRADGLGTGLGGRRGDHHRHRRPPDREHVPQPEDGPDLRGPTSMIGSAWIRRRSAASPTTPSPSGTRSSPRNDVISVTRTLPPTAQGSAQTVVLGVRKGKAMAARQVTSSASSPAA